MKELNIKIEQPVQAWKFNLAGERLAFVINASEEKVAVIDAEFLSKSGLSVAIIVENSPNHGYISLQKIAFLQNTKLTFTRPFAVIHMPENECRWDIKTDQIIRVDL